MSTAWLLLISDCYKRTFWLI